MEIKKLFAALLLTFTTVTNSVSASILGDYKYGSGLTIGHGLSLYENTFLSTQKGVGNQVEYYGEYTPNSSVVPVVVPGEEIYGRRDSIQVMEYMKKNSITPVLGINASFFSYQTGIPMGHSISDGVITSKESRSLPAVGFDENGKAFIDDLQITTTVHFGDNHVLEIPNINKYIFDQTPSPCLFTPAYGENTKAAVETINVVLDNVSDGIKIGKEVTCTVSDIFKSAEPAKIEDGKLLIAINSKGKQTAIDLINSMQKGMEITIKATANNEKWNNIKNAVASDGERLLTNGVVKQGLEAGAAPRTAVGIKEDGKVIFYVIDGRQTGYSYGVKKETLANRLKELGCVDAINLDGGGSTVISGVYHGCEENAIINIPSEGELRKVSNFIFLKNVATKTSTLKRAYIYPYSGNVLSGSRIQLSVKGVDENYYPVSVNEVSYTSNEFAKVSQSGELTVLGEGKVIVEATADGVSASAKLRSVISPDDIKIFDEKSGKEIDKLDVKPGESYALTAKAYYDGRELLASDEAFRWTLSDTADAKTDSLGNLSISQHFVEDVTLEVKAGSVKKAILVKGNSGANYPYSEIKIENNTLTIDMCSNNGAISTDSYFKIDGEIPDSYKYKSEAIDEKHIKITYPLDENFVSGYHKIFVNVSTDSGYSSVNSYKVTGTACDNIFADTQAHWARDIIAYMNKMGVVNGSEWDNEWVYRPDDGVTRAEFASMMCNYMKVNSEDYSDESLDVFADADKIPQWAKNSVRAAYSVGIINGKDNEGLLYFDPNARITRAEAATIISRVLDENMMAKSLKFADSNEVAAWAKRPFGILTTAGLISGYEDNTLRPNNGVTRAEAVTMLYNIY